MKGHRLVVGKPPLRPGGLTELAMRAHDDALKLGFSGIALIASRVRRSPSRYLQFHDQRGVKWRIRFSDHYCPGHLRRPDLDVISYDGTSGAELVAAFLQKIAAGEIRQSQAEPVRRRRPRC